MWRKAIKQMTDDGLINFYVKTGVLDFESFEDYEKWVNEVIDELQYRGIMQKAKMALSAVYGKPQTDK